MFVKKEAAHFSVISILSVLLIAGCAKQSSDSYDTSTAEVMAETIGGTASSSDSGGSVVSMIQNTGHKLSFKETLKEIALQAFESKAFAGACSTTVLVSGQSCTGGSSNVMTINLNGCTGLLGTWTGTDTLTYNTNAACSAASGSGLINMGASNNFILTSSGTTLTTYGGYAVETDSNSSGYFVPETGGITVACSAGGCSSSRTVTINGIHRKLSSPTGTTLFDHTFTTPTGFTITGTGSSKQITAGTIQLQHNLAHFIASGTITQALTFTANCCQPTGGQIVTTFSSGKTGTETTTFGPTCGVATVNGTTVALGYCQ